MVFYSLLEGTIIIIILLKVLHSQFFLRRMVNSLSVEYFDFHIKSMIHLICSNFTYKLTNIHTQRDKVRGRDSILHVAGTCSPSSGHSLPLSLFHLSYLALCRVSFPCNVTEFGYCFLQRCSTVISVAAKHTHTHAYTPMHWCMQRCRSHLAADFASLIDASNLPKFRTIRFFSYSNLIYFVFTKK